jgi:hypothetical protein
MIQLSDGCLIDPDQVASARISAGRTHITVRMRDGIGHAHFPGDGENIELALLELLYRIYGDPRPQQE